MSAQWMAWETLGILVAPIALLVLVGVGRKLMDWM